MRIMGKTDRRVVATRPIDTWAIAVLVAITALYLSIEIPFSASLLDALGGEATRSQLDVAEKTGRIVSGLAVAVALCGFVIPRSFRRGWSRPAKILVPVALATLVVAATYRGERSVVETIVDGSPVSLRAEALRVAYARKSLFGGASGLSGLSVSADDFEDPAWKAFRGVFGFVGHADERIMGRLPRNGAELVLRSVVEAFPSRETMRKDVMDGAMASARTGFAAFRDVLKAKGDATGTLAQRAERAWEEYHRGLYVRAGGSPRRPTWAVVREPIRSVLRAQGLEMPVGWDIDDKATFVAVAEEKGLREILSRYETASRTILGDDARDADAVTDFASFAALPSVQARIRKALGLAKGTEAILPGMTQAAFDRSVYRPLLSRRYADVVDAIATGRGLQDGAPLEREGREAVRMMVVPVVALGLSILGILVHAFKFANYGLTLAARKSSWKAFERFGAFGPARCAAAVGLVFVVGAALYRPAPEVLETAFYRHASERLASRSGEASSAFVRLVVEMEGGAYPLGKAMANVGPYRAFQAMGDGLEALGPTEAAASEAVRVP